MRTIKCKPWETMPRVRMNSKYIVTAENIDDDSKVAIRIYDLEAVMNPFADVDTLLLKTFKVNASIFIEISDKNISLFQVRNIEIYDMLVDEMHIILNGFYKKIEDGEIKENVTAIVRLNFNSTLMNSGRDLVCRLYGRIKSRLIRTVQFTFK